MKYQSLQTRPNHRIDRITPEGHVYDPESNNFLRTFDAEHTKCIEAPFGGFIEDGSMTEDLELVYLKDIRALCTDSEGSEIGYLVPWDNLVLGFYHQKKLYVGIFGGEPRYIIDKSMLPKPKATVHRIY